ncbi:MAG: methylmalonyl-CoA mutase family protein, partial [Dehalococcoidia bacterium]
MSDSKAKWEESTLKRSLESAGQRQERFELSSGAEVAPLYCPDDLPDWDYQRKLGYPGEFPFTRGVQASMYRGRLWTMRQYAGFGDAADSNRRYRYLLEQGQTG